MRMEHPKYNQGRAGTMKSRYFETLGKIELRRYATARSAVAGVNRMLRRGWLNEKYATLLKKRAAEVYGKPPKAKSTEVIPRNRAKKLFTFHEVVLKIRATKDGGVDIELTT